MGEEWERNEEDLGKLGKWGKLGKNLKRVVEGVI